MLETTKRVWLTEIPVFAVSIGRKFMKCHALLSPVQPKPIHCLICRAGSWDRTVLDHFLDVLVVCVFFHPNNWTQVKLRSKSRTWTWGGNWLAPGSLYYYVQFIWEANHVAKRHVLFSSFDQFQWFVCVWLTESRASKNLMLDDHSYIDMAINGIPHVHPFWDNHQSPKNRGSSCAGGVKDHDGWIYQSAGHFESFCWPIWTIYHLDSFPVLLIHFNLKKKQRSLWIVTSEWCCDAAARGCMLNSMQYPSRIAGPWKKNIRWRPTHAIQDNPRKQNC